tara:strand:- start:10053 stop:13514 length:3462 start_codon:yes stop_codon:yes gene_type:complete
VERNLELSVKLKTAVAGLAEIQNLIGEIDNVGGATEIAAGRSRALSDEIQKLEDSQKLVDNFRNIRLEVNKTGDELSDAQGEAQRLAKEFGSASEPTKKLKADFENARKTVQRLKETQIEQTVALQKSSKELENAGVSSQKLSTSQAKASESIQRTTDEIEDLAQELKQARDASAKEFKDPTDKLEKGAKSAGNAVETLGAKVKRVATIAIGSVTAFFGIREAIRGITGIVKVGGDFEILQTRLEALTGSAEAGEEAFAWIRDFTKNTPFQLNEVTDAFIRAKAFGLDPMNGTLQAVADQAAKTGGGIEALNGIVSALGQAYSKGKLQTEEMLQLIERGVPAWDLLAKATGRSAEELQKMTASGQLGRKEIKLLIDELGRAGEGAAAAQMKTLQGIVSNLRDTFIQFLSTINEAGLLEYAKTQIQGLADSFEEMRKSGELQVWAERISDSIIGFADAMKTGITFVRDWVSEIATLVKIFAIFQIGKAVNAVVSFGGAAFAAAKNTTIFGVAINSASVALTRFQLALLGLGAFVAGWEIGAYLRDKFVVVEKAGIALAGGLLSAWARIEFGWESLKAVFTSDTIGAAQVRLNAKLVSINDTMTDLFIAAERSHEGIKGVAKETENIADGVTSAAEKSKDALTEVAESAEDAADALAKNFGTSLQEIRTGISDTEKEALESFENFAKLGVTSVGDVETAVEKLQGKISSPEAVTQLTAIIEAWAKTSGENIDGVSEKLQSLAEDVKGTAEQIAADLSKAISAAGDEKTINEIRSRIGTLYSEGKIGAEEYTRALAEASDRQRELSEAGSETGKDVADGMAQATESVKEFGEEASRAEQIIGDTASRARGIADGISSFFNTVTANLISLSQKAHDAFINATGGETALRGLDEYRAKLETVEGQIRSMTNAVSADRSGVISWMKDTSIAASQVEADFYRQKIALEDLVQSLSNGGLAGRYMSDSIDSLGRRFDLLDGQDLSRLQGAIQRVQAEVSSLNDSLQDTISSLRQELAGLQGDNEQLEQLRYAEQRAELEAQLQKARSLGDREATAAAQEALNLSQQAYNIRLSQAKERTADEKARVAEQAAETERQRQLAEAQQRETTAQNFAQEDRQNTATQLPSRTIILQAPNGQRASVTTDNEDDLISVLESLGRRVS